MLSHTIRRRAISAVLAASILGILVPAATFAAEPTTTVCPDTHWPAAVQGRPINLHTGARGGDYLWHDRNGWHLRVTHHGWRKVVFTGSIVSTAPMSVRGVKLEKHDWFKLSADKLTLTYRFRNFGRIDGIDFKTACSQQLTIAGSMNANPLPLSRIWLGKHHVHPISNPFVVIKVS